MTIAILHPRAINLHCRFASISVDCRAMFVAQHKNGGRSLNMIALEEEGNQSRVAGIRAEALDGEWRCPQCGKDVLVRAGEVMPWHFAHRVAANCPFQSASRMLLEMQSCLYRWLDKKFPGRVRVEHFIDDSRLPRPVDCWVEGSEQSDRPSIAYWIFTRQMKGVEQRREIAQALEENALHVRLAFAIDMLNAAESDAAETDRSSSSDAALPEFVLSTTLRDGISESPFDVPPDDGGLPGTLHFLNPVNGGSLTTLRSLDRVHWPQIYRARRFDDLLENVSASEEGEFVHPGELDLLAQWRKEAEERQRELAEAQAAAAAYASRFEPERRRGRRAPAGRRPGGRIYTIREAEKYQPRKSPATERKDPRDSPDDEMDPPEDNYEYGADLPSILTMKFTCRRCGSEACAADAMEMHTGDRTCLCKRCIPK